MQESLDSIITDLSCSLYRIELMVESEKDEELLMFLQDARIHLEDVIMSLDEARSIVENG